MAETDYKSVKSYDVAHRTNGKSGQHKVPHADAAEYERLYKESISSPEKFWDKVKLLPSWLLRCPFQPQPTASSHSRPPWPLLPVLCGVVQDQTRRTSSSRTLTGLREASQADLLLLGLCQAIADPFD